MPTTDMTDASAPTHIATPEHDNNRARRARMLKAGLAIGFGVPFALGLAYRFAALIGWPIDFASIRLNGELAVILALLVLTIEFESLPIGSLGLHRIRAQDVYFGLLAGAGLIVVSALMALLALRGSQHVNLFADFIKTLTPSDSIGLRSMPLWLAVLVTLAATFAEELVARGYAIRRLRAITRTSALAAIVAIAIDIVARMPLWGVRYALVMLPAEAILAGLYIWRRQLTTCIVAHWTLALPLVLALFMLPTGTVAPTSVASSAPSLDEEMAIVELRKSMGESTGPGSGAAERAENLFYKHDYPHALEQIEDAIKLEPKNAFYFGVRAAIHVAQDNTWAAISDYTAMIELRPDDPRIYRERARRYKTMRDFPKAASDLDKAIALAPKDALNFEERASLHYWQQQYPEAIADLTTAIGLDPSNRRLLMDRAYFYEHIGQHSRALDDCNALIKSDPTRPEGYECRFNIYQSMGNANEAIAAATSAIAFDPNNAELYVTRGNLQLSLGRWREAHDDFEKVASLAPDDPEKIDGVAWRLATSTSDEVRDGKAALKLALRENELTGYNRNHYLETLAASYAEVGDFADAIKWETAALSAADATDSDDRERMRQILKTFQEGQPIRETNGGGFAGPRPMRAYIGAFVMLILAAVGLIALIYWSIKWSLRRVRRIRQGAAPS